LKGLRPAVPADLHQELEALLLVVRQWPARWAAAQQRLQQLEQGGEGGEVTAGFWLMGPGGWRAWCRAAWCWGL
jgi:hypothetical protein